MHTALRLISTIVIIFILLIIALAISRSSIPYDATKIVKINKLYDIGLEICKDNEGLSHIRYNTIFHHKLYCNDGTAIRYAKEL